MSEEVAGWVCRNCESSNFNENEECEICGEARPVRFWPCPLCETSNPETHEFCEVCGYERHEELVREMDEPVSLLPAEVTETYLPVIAGEEWAVPGYIKVRDFSTLRPKKGVFSKLRSWSAKKKKKWLNGTLAGAFGFLIASGVLSITGFWAVISFWIFGWLGIKIFPGLGRVWSSILEPPHPDPKALPEMVGNAPRYQPGHEREIVGLDFSVDGNLLYSSDSGGMVYIWDVATGESKSERRVFLNPPRKVRIGKKGAYANDGQMLRIYGPNQNLLWSLTIRLPISLDSPFELSPGDNRYISMGMANGTIFLYDLKKRLGKNLNDNSFSKPTGIAFFPDGKKLITGSATGALKIWEISFGRVVSEDIRQGFKITCVAIGGDGRRFAAGYDDGTVRVFNAPVYKENIRLRILEGEGKTKNMPVPVKMKIGSGPEPLLCIADSNGRILVFRMMAGGTTELVDELQTGGEEISEMALSRHRQWLAVGTKSGKLIQYFLGKYL